MGQRHQFFAIARVKNRYRTLAVIHNQWLYGHSAARQCLITMRILRATGNLQGISRDLKLAESKPESFWEAQPKDQGERVSLSVHAAVPLTCATCTSVRLHAGSITTSHANLGEALYRLDRGHEPRNVLVQWLSHTQEIIGGAKITYLHTCYIAR